MQKLTGKMLYDKSREFMYEEWEREGVRFDVVDWWGQSPAAYRRAWERLAEWLNNPQGHHVVLHHGLYYVVPAWRPDRLEDIPAWGPDRLEDIPGYDPKPLESPGIPLAEHKGSCGLRKGEECTCFEGL